MDDPLAEVDLDAIAAAPPADLLAQVGELAQTEDVGVREISTLAETLATEHEINLYRVMSEHPDLVGEHFSDQVAVPAGLIQRYDDLIADQT
ncbi:MAG: hypothetical protein U5K37_08485 [Natrialbaceae archaeon]|nr:hypothetical protein [Natrialbaceae archaeon]